MTELEQMPCGLGENTEESVAQVSRDVLPYSYREGRRALCSRAPQGIGGSRMFRSRLGFSMGFALVFSAMLSLAAAAPVGAFPAPVNGSMKCSNGLAGWIVNAGDGSYSWDGSLKWQMCVVKVDGQRKAKIQLSSDATDPNDYDRFTGLVNIRLQRCTTTDYYTIGSGSGGASGYDVGTQSSGRYQFDPVSSAWSSQASTQGYRVWIQTWNASVIGRSILAQPIALSPDGLIGEAIFTSICLDI